VAFFSTSGGTTTTTTTTTSSSSSRDRDRQSLGLLHLGLIGRPFVPHIQMVPSSPEALRTTRRERPLLAKEGNCTYEFFQQPIMNCSWWVLLHAPKLGHGTDYFTSPPKEGMLRIFRPGLNPRTREPEASMLTTRPPKPL
jgi:hypothetical protein